jgi:hypothetical protein
VIRLWNRWVEACTRTERGTSMALFRIAIGTVLFVDTAYILYSGALDPLYRPYAEGGFAPVRNPYPLIELLGGPSIALVHALSWTALVLAGLLALGVAGRVPALGILQIRLALHSLPVDIGGGYDRMLENGLWLLVIAGGTATLSVACRMRSGRWTSDREVFAFPRHFAILQLVVLYTFTGLVKGDTGWKAPYEAVFRTLQDTTHSYWDLVWVSDFFVLTQIATVTTHWWEMTFAVAGLAYGARLGWFGERVLRWARRFDLRIPYIVVGLGLHVGLFVAVNVATFSPVTLAFYIAFLDPDEWSRLGAWIRRRGRPIQTI